jgi:hypothetical protein
MLLGRERWSRRSFLVRASLFGSALAVDPRGFAIEGRSAYHSVCGTDAECGDGFTAFCCTIEHGANLCPEGTFVGGWWKADRSAFCRGEARYYVDCNSKAGWPWHCHCPETATCDHRHVACVRFRYGNCSLEVPEEAVGTTVVCRVVTCTPPWVWDPACSETSFTDDLTASHSAPCLPAPWSPPLIIRWSDLGGPGGPLGSQVSSIERIAGTGTWARFRHGAIFDVSGTGVLVVAPPIWGAVRDRLGPDGVGVPLDEQRLLHAGDGWSQVFGTHRGGRVTVDAEVVGCPALGTHVVAEPVLARWASFGRESGILGYPTRSTGTTPDGTSTFGNFAKLDRGRLVHRGAIYANPLLGVHALWGDVFDQWRALGGEGGPLGYPSSGIAPAGVAGSSFAQFAVVRHGVVSRGAIYRTQEFGTKAIEGPIFEAWAVLGGTTGRLGYPKSDVVATTDRTGTYATFRPLPVRAGVAGGGIVSTATSGTWALFDTFLAVWLADEKGPRLLGAPVAAEIDQTIDGVALRSQAFRTGTVYDSAVGADCVLYGPILTTYLQDGGPTGELGLATSSVTTLGGGDEQATFEHGTLTYVPGQGVTQS